MALNEGREVLNLRDDELEELIKKWIAQEAAAYVDFDRNSGAGDRGIDAVGFLTHLRYEGAWHNYQCKQLKTSLGEPEFFAEIGKTIYYASLGEFTMPARYVFVAPQGISRGVRKYLGMPSALKNELLNNWTGRCAFKIVEKLEIQLNQGIIECIANYDFSQIVAWNAHKLVEQPNLRKVLHAHVEIDPGTAPAGVVPPEVNSAERRYIEQLLAAYGDHCNTVFIDEHSVFSHPDYGPDLTDQRRRYHDADAFHRHFRDSVDETILTQFDQDIYDGVIDDYRLSTGYYRLISVMKAAGKTEVSGIFGRHKRAPVSVKQGICHHFVNRGKIRWTK